MNTSEILKNFFDQFKANFSPSKAITLMEMGFKNISTVSGVSLLFLLDGGTDSIDTTEDGLDDINCVIVVQNTSSLDQMMELLTYKDELTDFFKDNHRLGGVNDITIDKWTIDVSQDGIKVGVLTYLLTLSVVR